MTVRCESCGASSTSGAGYARVRDRRVCPRCLSAERARATRPLLYMLVAMGGVAAIWAALSPRATGPMLLVQLVTTVVAMFIAAPIHEVGHAALGRLAGLTVHAIDIGSGTPRLKRRVFGVPVTIRTVPIGGLTLASHGEVRGYRRRQLLYILGGPLANLLTALALSTALPPLGRIDLTHGWQPLFALTAANVIMGFGNLVPFVATSERGRIPTDGAAILALPFLTPAAIVARTTVHWALVAHARLTAGDRAGARAAFEMGLARDPRSALLRNDLADLLMREGRLEEAQRELRQVVADADAARSHSHGGLQADAVVRAIAQQNLALVDVLLGRPELLEEADRASLDALAERSYSPHARAVRGLVLAARGRHDEGRALATPALDELDEPALAATLRRVLDRLAPASAAADAAAAATTPADGADPQRPR